jgi:hypothetical protein
VVGIVVGKYDAVAEFLKEGELPERINFAIPIDECKGVMSEAYPFGYPPSSANQELEPSVIFKSAKPAIVLVVAKLPARPDAKNGQASPPESHPDEDNLSGGEVLELVSLFVSGGNSDKPLDVAAFYALKSLYMDHGQVDVAFIRNDLAEYWQKWPVRHCRLISSPSRLLKNP